MSKMVSKFALAAGIMLALAFTFSCFSSPPTSQVRPVCKGGDGYTDSYGELTYESKTYKTVKIGDQTWMAENLNFNAEGSKCYENDPANCTKYGRLYDWATAMDLDEKCNKSGCKILYSEPHKGICPSGWHIPSNEEWKKLVNFVGINAGIELKATSGWDSPMVPNKHFGSCFGSCTDEFGFSALPGGYGGSNGNFGFVDFLGWWWSVTEPSLTYAELDSRKNFNVNIAYAWNMRCSNATLDPSGSENKSNFYSVRCVQD